MIGVELLRQIKSQVDETTYLNLLASLDVQPEQESSPAPARPLIPRPGGSPASPPPVPVFIAPQERAPPLVYNPHQAHPPAHNPNWSHQRQGSHSRNAGSPANVISDRKIFVGGLHYDTSNDELFSFFDQTFGSVQEAHTVKNRDGQSRGFGFVIFKDVAARNRAVQSDNVECDGARVDIRAATPPQHNNARGGSWSRGDFDYNRVDHYGYPMRRNYSTGNSRQQGGGHYYPQGGSNYRQAPPPHAPVPVYPANPQAPVFYPSNFYAPPGAAGQQSQPDYGHHPSYGQHLPRQPVVPVRPKNPPPDAVVEVPPVDPKTSVVKQSAEGKPSLKTQATVLFEFQDDETEDAE